MSFERKCPSCGAPCFPDEIICTQCGTNLRTGFKMEPPITSDDEIPPSAFHRFLYWLGGWFPGIFRPSCIFASIVLALLGLFVMGLCLVIMGMGAVISAFFIGGMGVIIYAQGVVLILVGEFMILHEALAEMENKKWTIFFVFITLPIVFFVLLMKASMAAQ